MLKKLKGGLFFVFKGPFAAAVAALAAALKTKLGGGRGLAKTKKVGGGAFLGFR